LPYRLRHGLQGVAAAIGQPSVVAVVAVVAGGGHQQSAGQQRQQQAQHDRDQEFDQSPAVAARGRSWRSSNDQRHAGRMFTGRIQQRRAIRILAAPPTLTTTGAAAPPLQAQRNVPPLHTPASRQTSTRPAGMPSRTCCLASYISAHASCALAQASPWHKAGGAAGKGSA
jgi:hypothetical protein